MSAPAVPLGEKSSRGAENPARQIDLVQSEDNYAAGGEATRSAQRAQRQLLGATPAPQSIPRRRSFPKGDEPFIKLDKNVTASEMDRRTPPLAPGRRLQLGLQASLASARPGRPYSEGLRHVGPPPGARVRSVSGWLRQKQKGGARHARTCHLAAFSWQLVRTLIDPIDAGKSALGTPLAHRRSGSTANRRAGRVRGCDERRPCVAVSRVCGVSRVSRSERGPHGKKKRE